MTQEALNALVARIKSHEEQDDRDRLLRSIEDPAVLEFIEKLEAEQNELLKDKARLDWLMTEWNRIPIPAQMITRESIDAEIASEPRFTV